MVRLLLSAATLVVIFFVLSIFGDDAPRPMAADAEVARADGGTALDIDLASWIPAEAILPDRSLPRGAMSEDEAIRLEAGRAHREGREPEPLLGKLIAAVETPAPETTDALSPDTWYVTGSTVNVRSGPGTGNPVVTQVSLGEAAEVLEEAPNGWLRIRPEGGEATGWISGNFMEPDAPG